MSPGNKHSIRILHVVGGMNRGGIETWLMHVLRYVDRDRFQIDFLVHTTQHCTYDDEIRSLGSRIIPCPKPQRFWIYAFHFKQLLYEYGPYDIVHSHVHHFSGLVLYLAQLAGVPVRIAHTHTNTSSKEDKAGLSRRFYLALMKWWIARYGTLGLAASSKAGVALFGSGIGTYPRWRNLYCGVDLTTFYDVVEPVAVRAEFGIPTDAFVLGHVGRFVESKNHKFLIEIAAEVAKREPRIRLLLVGDGPLRAEIEAKVQQAGLADLVIFTGSRSDVPQLMLGGMDIFLFPSLYEGLGLVLIEAQAAGMPCIFSDVVPEEADVVKPLVRRLSLSRTASEWAEVLLEHWNSVSSQSQSDALALVENSQFNLETSVKELQNIYQTQLIGKVVV